MSLLILAQSTWDLLAVAVGCNLYLLIAQLSPKKRLHSKATLQRLFAFYYLLIGHILQQAQWEGNDPNPFCPVFYMCLLRNLKGRLQWYSPNRSPWHVYTNAWCAQLGKCVCVHLTHCFSTVVWNLCTRHICVREIVCIFIFFFTYSMHLHMSYVCDNG